MGNEAEIKRKYNTLVKSGNLIGFLKWLANNKQKKAILTYWVKSR